MTKKLLWVTVLTALIFALSVSVVFTANSATVSTAANDGEYEIYPNPHFVEYGAANVSPIRDDVYMYLSDELDGATAARAYEAVSQLDVLAHTDEGQYSHSFYFGVYGSGDKADEYVKNNNIIFSTKNLFDKTDAYLLVIGKKATVVLGKDTDAAFYGLTTLKVILSQVENRKARMITIEDWSDSLYRGFIEGYYGIPWTTDERVELMRFGSDFKTNVYIYAPKNDPYHSTNWRSLYSDADLNEIKEQVQAGEESKTRFVWAAHPFNHSAILPGSQYQSGISALIAKFEQLYSVGVRQFVVSADDVDGDTVGAANRWNTELARDILNDVAEWCKSKGDCRNLIFVPNAYYTNASGSTNGQTDPASLPQNYLTGISDGLDETVDIMWTGHNVCSSVTNGDFDLFTQWTGRKAFMWMNWPVNDYADGKLIMSKAEVYDMRLAKDASAPFLGIVTNPMQYAEADKLSIFATADYAWNINGFDADKNYSDSFKYVESICYDELKILCDNLANASKFQNKYFEEAPELQAAIDAFWSDYDQNSDFTSTAEALIGEFQKITSAADTFLSDASNRKLVQNLLPYVQSLRSKSSACVLYLESLTYFDELSKEDLQAKVTQADELIKGCAEFKTPVLNKISYDHEPTSVDTGIAVINPFIGRIAEALSDNVKPALGMTSIVYKGFDSIYQGQIENIVDGKEDTCVWFGSYPTEDSQVRIGLGYLTTVTSIDILTGNLAGNDVWNATVQYSVDGVNYVTLGNITEERSSFDLTDNPIQARFIRLINGDNFDTWVAIREITVNKVPLNELSGSE